MISKSISAALLLGLFAAPALAGHAKREKRVVVSFGRPSGESLATSLPDGTLSIDYQHVINGRGPKVAARIRLAPDKTLASYAATGQYTLGTKLDERFDRAGGRARWKSEEERGEREVKGRAFFVPMAELPDTYGLLAGALLDAGGRLALLPGGEARLEKVSTVSVTAKDGRTRRVVGYAITGLSLDPVVVWMNEDRSWFGVVNPWYSVVPDAWEAAIQPLIAEQDRLVRERDAKLAATHAHRPPPAGLAYTHARVLDVERGRWLPDQTVVVVGDKIAEIGPSARVKPPAGAEVVDLAGKALLPGLWDMHAHLDDVAGVLNVASGVTTVRDVGNSINKLDDLKRRFDEGTAVGPRVYRFGFIEGRNEKAATSDVTAETVEEAKAGVAEYVKRGYEGIKIYNSVKAELVPVITREAHKQKLLVTGHVPVHMFAHEVVRAGYDGLEHINMLLLNFLATRETDTRDTTRFTLVGDKAPDLDLASKPVRDFVALLAQRRILVTPTLAVFEGVFAGEPGKIVPGIEGLVARLPVQTQRLFLQNGLPDRSKAARYRATYDKCLALVKLLHDRGVPVAAGTDWVPGLGLHHELELFVRAGIPPAKAIAAATIVPARALRVAGRTGSIARGKLADLVVIDGDPLARIADIGKVVSTMRGGVVYPSGALYTAIGVRPN